MEGQTLEEGDPQGVHCSVSLSLTFSTDLPEDALPTTLIAIHQPLPAPR